MGTNFYWHDEELACKTPCAHCACASDIHVGKRSAGWSFGFRAWPHRLMNAEYPDWGFDPSSPFGFEVASRADWRKVFTERAGKLVDEYGRLVEDPIAWLDDLEPPDAEKIQWEAEQRRSWDSATFTEVFRDKEWRDAENFHFGAYEFS